MALEMRRACERCGQPIRPDGVAWICSFECSFCSACAEQQHHTCPSCGGGLVRRPRRNTVVTPLRAHP